MTNYSKPVAIHHASSETPTFTETKFSTEQILRGTGAPESKTDIATTKANPLNLRTEKDMSSAPIMTFQPNTKIAYEELDEEWVKVVGYVKKKYITVHNMSSTPIL